MITAPTQPPEHAIDNPGNWTREEFSKQPYKTQLPSPVVEELYRAVALARKRELRAARFGKNQFPLPETEGFLSNLSTELEAGKGFLVLSGLNIDDLTQQDCETLFWGIGLYLGQSVPINADGDLVGHVRDLGLDIQNPNVRNYQTTEELKLHNDTCDILGLMCLRNAKSGGDSAIASAIAIHNAILDSRPDLLRELYTPMAIDRRGEKGWPEEGDSPWFALPIFSYYKNLITTRYTVHEYYYEAQKFSDAPRLTAKQEEALEYLRATARDPRFHFEFRLEPGDIQLLNNYCTLHARTHFEDYPEPERKRHLLRLWLSTSNSRPLHPIFSKRYRSADAGALRGGIAPRA
ncbi:MAG: TauD/TfdA family dioxygenase [Granulosicoccus sp.]|nr:TauD/TfdA family dioxygenase [Granulosicoccus sp.]